MIKGIIFDMGGTLMSFDGAWEQVDVRSNENLIAFLNAQNITTPPDFRARFLEHRRRHWRSAEETGVESRLEDALRDVLVELGYESRDHIYQRGADAYFAINEQYWHAYPDAVDTLRELHACSLHIGVISNADDERLVHRAALRLGFAPFVNPVLSSASEPRWRKPDARIFYLVSNAWQLAPHEIAMVGDATRYDIVGAHNAGMRGILIERGDNLPWQKIPEEFVNDPLWKPDAVVHALAEIPSVLDSWVVE